MHVIWQLLFEHRLILGFEIMFANGTKITFLYDIVSKISVY
jgi:hypothetical protein